MYAEIITVDPETVLATVDMNGDECDTVELAPVDDAELFAVADSYLRTWGRSPEAFGGFAWKRFDFGWRCRVV